MYHADGIRHPAGDPGGSRAGSGMDQHGASAAALGSALFDARRHYRYALARTWQPGDARVAFIMLNPSGADASRDDPTIRRCMGFARAWGFGGVDVVNLFAARTPHPALLRRRRRPVGPDNDRHLLRVCRAAGLVIAAWGVHGAWQGRDRAVLSLLARAGLAPRCLGLTQDGHPRHPLYLPRRTQPEPFPASGGNCGEMD